MQKTRLISKRILHDFPVYIDVCLREAAGVEKLLQFPTGVGAARHLICNHIFCPAPKEPARIYARLGRDILHDDVVVGIVGAGGSESCRASACQRVRRFSSCCVVGVESPGFAKFV
jgi:hypothetical protein